MLVVLRFMKRAEEFEPIFCSSSAGGNSRGENDRQESIAAVIASGSKKKKAWKEMDVASRKQESAVMAAKTVPSAGTKKTYAGRIKDTSGLGNVTRKQSGPDLVSMAQQASQIPVTNFCSRTQFVSNVCRELILFFHVLWLLMAKPG